MPATSDLLRQRGQIVFLGARDRNIQGRSPPRRRTEWRASTRLPRITRFDAEPSTLGTGTFRRRRQRAAALDGQRGAAGPSRSSGPCLPLRQLLFPRSSRTSLPEGPVGSRESPQPQGREALRFTGIPADPRSTRKRHDRPVTPEVAGSSPVAPVKVPANWRLLLPHWTKSTGDFLSSRAHPARESPQKAGRSR